MRIGTMLVLSLAGAIVGATALVTAPVGARPARRTAHVKVQLPAVDQSQVTAITVKATAAEGKRVGSVKVRTTNEAVLPNISAIYLTQAPRTHSRVMTFKVFVVVKRFPNLA